MLKNIGVLLSGSYVCRSQGRFLDGWGLWRSPSYSSGSSGPLCCVGSHHTRHRSAVPLRATVHGWSDSSRRDRYTCTLGLDGHVQSKRAGRLFLAQVNFKSPCNRGAALLIKLKVRFMTLNPFSRCVYMLCILLLHLTLLAHHSLWHSCGVPTMPLAACHGWSLKRGAQRSQWSPAVLCLHTHLPWTCSTNTTENYSDFNSSHLNSWLKVLLVGL